MASRRAGESRCAPTARLRTLTDSRTFTFHAASLADTDQLGAALAAVLPDGTTVSLNGTLGAGKTRLVQALAAACGVRRDEVLSPTFVLCQHYQGTRQFHHLDVYRLRDEDEFLELGVEELFASSGITLIEWGERMSRCLPADRLDILIRVTSDTSREFTIITCGKLDETICDRLRDFLSS